MPMGLLTRLRGNLPSRRIMHVYVSPSTLATPVTYKTTFRQAMKVYEKSKIYDNKHQAKSTFEKLKKKYSDAINASQLTGEVVKQEGSMALVHFPKGHQPEALLTPIKMLSSRRTRFFKLLAAVYSGITLSYFICLIYYIFLTNKKPIYENESNIIVEFKTEVNIENNIGTNNSIELKDNTDKQSKLLEKRYNEQVSTIKNNSESNNLPISDSTISELDAHQIIIPAKKYPKIISYHSLTDSFLLATDRMEKSAAALGAGLVWVGIPATLFSYYFSYLYWSASLFSGFLSLITFRDFAQ